MEQPFLLRLLQQSKVWMWETTHLLTPRKIPRDEGSPKEKIPREQVSSEEVSFHAQEKVSFEEVSSEEVSFHAQEKVSFEQVSSEEVSFHAQEKVSCQKEDFSKDTLSEVKFLRIILLQVINL